MMAIIASLSPSPGFWRDWQSNSVYGKKGEERRKAEKRYTSPVELNIVSALMYIQRF